MKCAFVASYYGPYYSNFIASMLAFHDGMTKNGHEVCYVFPREAESFEWLPLLKKKTNKIYFIGYHGFAWKDICSLRKIFKLENVDLIYSHMCGWDFSAHFCRAVHANCLAHENGSQLEAIRQDGQKLD